jgi:hypothetical protein
MQKRTHNQKMVTMHGSHCAHSTHMILIERIFPDLCRREAYIHIVVWNTKVKTERFIYLSTLSYL